MRKKTTLRKKRTSGFKKKSSSIKTMVNKIIKKHDTEMVEKKRININFASVDYSMGQTSGSSEGFYAGNISPVIAETALVGGRIGHEIKLTSCFITMQFRQMLNCSSPVQIKVYVVLAPTPDVDAGTMVGKLWDHNGYIGNGTNIHDTGSSLNTDYMTQFRIIRRLTVNMQGDSVNGQQMPVQKNLGIKFRKPLTLRYNTSSGVSPINNNIYLIAFANNGNASAVTPCYLSNASNTAISTGQYINFACKWYYTDQ